MHSRTTVLCFIVWLKHDYNPGIFKSSVGPLLPSKRIDLVLFYNINTNGRNMKHHNRNFQLYVTLDRDQTGATSIFIDSPLYRPATLVLFTSKSLKFQVKDPSVYSLHLSHQHEIKMPFVPLELQSCRNISIFSILLKNNYYPL